MPQNYLKATILIGMAALIWEYKTYWQVMRRNQKTIKV